MSVFEVYVTNIRLIMTFVCISLLYLGDILSTFFFLKKYHKEFPKEDWTIVEQNPIVRFFLKKFGLKKGVIISIFVTYLIIIPVMILSSHSQFLFGIVVGFYLMLFRVHLATWMQLSEAVKKRKEKHDKIK